MKLKTPNIINKKKKKPNNINEMPISDCEQETEMTACTQMTSKETTKAYKKKSKTEEDMKTMKASTKVKNRTIKRIRNSE